MGKRKKSSRKPAAASAARRRQPLDTAFTCLFCNHDKSVSVRLDRKEGIGQLVCRVCDQRYQSKANHLTEPIDIYSEWIDAADAARKEDQIPRRPAASSSRPAPAPPSVGSDDD